MSTEDEKEQAVREQAASMTEKQLVRWMGIFEHMRGIEAGIGEIAGQPAPPDPFVNLPPPAVLAILRAELKKRQAVL